MNTNIWLNRLAVVVTLLIILSSCRVKFIPDYRADISKQIDETSKKVDKFYLSMLETTDNANRPFGDFVGTYVDTLLLYTTSLHYFFTLFFSTSLVLRFLAL
jgi:hypothetical protein